MSEPSVAVQCSACQAAIEIPHSWLGKRRPCPKCHTWIQLPDHGPGEAGSANGSASGSDTATAAANANRPAIDPYGDTMISRPGIATPASSASDLHPAAPSSENIPTAPNSAAPLTFAERMKQISSQANAPSTPAAEGIERPSFSARPANPPTAGGPAASRGPDTAKTPGQTGRTAGTGVGTGFGRANAAPARNPRDPDGRAWDDDLSSDRTRDPAERPRRGRRSAEELPEKGSATIAYIGFGSAIGALALSALACLGLAMAASSGNGGSNGVTVLFAGCSLLGIPVLVLIGTVFSTIALFTNTSKRGLAIGGLVICCLFILVVAVGICIGIAKG